MTTETEKFYEPVDSNIIHEFTTKKEGEIKAVPVRVPDGQTILHYQLIWEILGNMPDEDQQIVIGGKYKTAEDAMVDVIQSQTKNVSK